MQPYRLKHTTDNVRGKDLYAFWGSSITDLLNKDMKAAKTDTLVNLASNEYQIGEEEGRCRHHH